MDERARDSMGGIVDFAAVTAMAVLLSFPVSAVGQVIGDKAEMGRLQAKAEEAIANDDPDGAAMAMGRAALMAGQLAKRQTGIEAQVHRAQESLFRSQEHTYRAMALFRRAGGHLPASSGVCGSLALAHGGLRQTVDAITAAASLPSADAPRTDVAPLRDAVDNWSTVVESLIAEYQCP
jgi:hypothetical protein